MIIIVYNNYSCRIVDFCLNAPDLCERDNSNNRTSILNVFSVVCIIRSMSLYSLPISVHLNSISI